MFGIKEFLMGKNLTLDQRDKLIKSKVVDPGVLSYLKEILNPLYVNIMGTYEGLFMDLVLDEKFESWCWQSTESGLVFFNDDDYLERGFLYLSDRQPNYYHSWICFKYGKEEYVFDPALNYLCKKKYYSKIFEVRVGAIVYAKDIKEELINQIEIDRLTPKEHNGPFDDFLRLSLGDDYEEFIRGKDEETIVHGPEDINTPFYRNGAGYKAVIEDGVVKKLSAHFYCNDC